MSLVAAKEMAKSITPGITMPGDYCMNSSGSAFGNDDNIKRAINSVISENIICIALIVVVVLITGIIVYYVGRTLIDILKEYREHTAKTQAMMVDTYQVVNDENSDDEVYEEPERMPQVPEVESVQRRIKDIEKRYKTYNEEISKRRDGTEAVMDARIVSREEDNYTYKKGVPEPTIKV